MYLFTKARKSPQCKLKYILTSMGAHGILLARIDQASNKIVFDHYKAAKVEKIEDVNGAGMGQENFTWNNFIFNR